jgi:hypothetical protein
MAKIVRFHKLGGQPRRKGNVAGSEGHMGLQNEIAAA